MKKALLFSLLTFSFSADAGGWSSYAVPTGIDIERSGGFMVYGRFGNAGNCSVGDKLYIKKEHPQYQAVYSMILSAYLSKKKIQAYVHSCAVIGWYTANDTFNIVEPRSSISIRD
ncbi:hypothetical protein SOPP22_01460 [Shewanella sp. OPT22]|nr:hypothetical protein SOPP22_01460 [Shewanella sp. OPT22]